MNLRKNLILLSLATLVVSCNKGDYFNLTLEELPKGEVFISKSFQKKWGTATGSRNLYVVYGKTPLGEPAGVGVAPDHKFLFSIDELQKKWPEIRDPRVTRSASIQSTVMVKKVGLDSGQQKLEIKRVLR
jgi:hypothetical protein